MTKEILSRAQVPALTELTSDDTVLGLNGDASLVVFDAAAFGGGGDVVHVVAGNDANTARPSGAGLVIWIVYSNYVPNNAEENDIVVIRSEPEGPDVTPPATPTGLAATPGNEQVVLSWDANGEVDFDHYDYRVDAGTAVSTGTTAGATVTGLVNDQEYDFQVRAVDDSDNASAWSSVVSATPVDSVNLLDEAVALHAFWAEDPDWTNPGNGNPVDSWRNDSGGGDVTSTTTERPTFRSSVTDLNNRAALEFDGTNDRLYVDVADQALPFKMVVVCLPASPLVNRNAVGINNGNANRGIYPNVDSNWTANSGNALTGTVAASAVATLVVARFNNPSGATLHVNGTSVATGTTGAQALTHLAIGAGVASGPTFSRFWQGHIAFVGIYADATDISGVITACAAHYGITLP